MLDGDPSRGSSDKRGAPLRSAEASAIDPRAAVVREQLAKILESRLFVTAERRSRLLRFLVERSLESRGHGIKEHEVGIEVFSRPSSWDPRLDPIVRVQVGNLRSKLTEYYAGAGKDDPLLIEFPKGYIARFKPRPVLQTRSVRPDLHAIPSGSVAKEKRKTAKTVAVLPFADLSPHHDQEYFCDGVTDEIINALSQSKQVRVVARTSSFRFKGKNLDVRRIGAQLNAGAVLEGSIRREGDRLRLVAHLTSVYTGYVLWSDEYDEPTPAVFSVQDRITRALVDALVGALNGARRHPPPRPSYRANVELYDQYLLGRFYLNKRTEEALQKSASLFQQIITRDASYAPAFAGLSECYRIRALIEAAPPGENMERARDAATKALALDNTLAEAHTSLGTVQALHDWQWSEAQKTFQRAIHLNPCSSFARHHYGLFSLGPSGKLQKAMDELREAVSLDPLSLIMRSDSAFMAHLAGKDDDAISQCRAAIDMDPGFFQPYMVLGKIYSQKGIYPEGIQYLQKGRELAGSETYVAPILATLALANERAGNHDQARQFVEELESPSRTGYVSPFWVGIAQFGVNATEQAFSWLQRACDLHDPWLFALPNSPIAAQFKSDDRYRALLRRMGLA
jgi:TolB-like protein/Tfp pilus assembly protein PilF